MARFYGKVGYGESVEKSDGVWDDVITEFNYYGDVVQNSRRLSEGESVNSNILVSNSISIVADDHAMKHFHAIRYVEWGGGFVGSNYVYGPPPPPPSQVGRTLQWPSADALSFKPFLRL